MKTCTRQSRLRFRRVGMDAISARQAGRMGASDESQLSYAAKEGHVILTFNVAHFAALHQDWLQQGRSHAGIVLSKQRRICDLLPRLIRMGNAVDATGMCGRLEFLSDW